MIDLKTLRELVKLMKNNDLTELDIQDETEKVKLRRGSKDQPQVQVMPTAAAPAPAPAAAAPAPAPAATPAPTTDGGSAQDDGLLEITSPTVGTFYSASSPDADPFASVGTKVKVDAVVCIVEAMKVFNEIKSEVAGTIAEVLVENGDAVEFGQPLFKVKPN